MANRYMKRSSISLVIREMQIKITMRDHFILVTIVIIKKREMTNTDGDVKKWEPLCTISRNVNWCSLSGEQY